MPPMDRNWPGRDGSGGLELELELDLDLNPAPARLSPADSFALPSRGEAIVVLRPALEGQLGPALITGEPGVGKTWLWRRLQAEMPWPWRWRGVDIPPSLDPGGLYSLIGHGLGLPPTRHEARARLALADFFREAAAEGAHWVLVLDEAHNASVAVLEEVRLLANRLGRPDGVGALILVGQTALARRLAVRPQNALVPRLAAHVHLRGLDFEEARAFVRGLAPAANWDERTLERRHRDAGGNPRRLLLAARPGTVPRVGRPAMPIKPAAAAAPAPAPPALAATSEEWETPELGPTKPPLMVGDGMIEVGWEPAPEPLETPQEPATSRFVAPTPDGDGDRDGDGDAVAMAVAVVEPVGGGRPELPPIESVNDHYAVLQAWNEWARNQGRAPSPQRTDPDAPDPTAAPASPAPASVWRDGQQGFAPYGQLFSRLRQIRDVNESG
jgi:type II secretory pathway predicted ATPase ExeA